MLVGANSPPDSRTIVKRTNARTVKYKKKQDQQQQSTIIQVHAPHFGQAHAELCGQFVLVPCT